MGQAFEFKCQSCGYSVTSSGKFDVGFIAVVDTYICQDCKIVVDVHIGEYGKVFNPENLDKNQLTEFYCCPKCQGNNIFLWDILKKSCPKCSDKMIRDESVFINWD